MAADAEQDSKTTKGATVRRADDMILISVDDHIAEPADMFDAHVPERYRDRAPTGRDRRARLPAVVVRRQEGAQPRAQRGGRQAAGDVQRQPAAATTRCARAASRSHERVRDMSAGGQLAGLNFPNWTGFSGQVLNEGPDPRGQRGHDQGVQRLARRRMVRRLSRPVHPVRHPARCSTSTRRPPRCGGSPPRAATP